MKRPQAYRKGWSLCTITLNMIQGFNRCVCVFFFYLAHAKCGSAKIISVVTGSNAVTSSSFISPSELPSCRPCLLKQSFVRSRCGAQSFPFNAECGPYVGLSNYEGNMITSLATTVLSTADAALFILTSSNARTMSQIKHGGHCWWWKALAEVHMLA